MPLNIFRMNYKIGSSPSKMQISSHQIQHSHVEICKKYFRAVPYSILNGGHLGVNSAKWKFDIFFQFVLNLSLPKDFVGSI